MKKILFFIPFFLFANVLSNLQNELINKDLNKAIVSGDKLKDSWINPINLQYKYNQTNQTSTLQKTNSFVISVNQPIFKSGAIYQSLKYANFLKKENIQKIELQKRTLIKQVYEILFNIKKTDILIQKQKLLIKNSEIDIKRKKEQFLSGVIDSSFLDNAIINKNNLLLVLDDYKLQKINLINNLKNLSDLDYKDIQLPTFKLVSKKDYLNNLNLNIAKQDIKVKQALKYMNIGNSLVSVNIVANYNDITTKYNEPSLIYKNNSDSFYNLGISITLPLSVNTLKTIKESKLDYLKSVLNYKNEKIKALNEYNTKLKDILSIQNKMIIYDKTIQSYKSLLNSTKDNIKAGINTILDLENLENSLNIAILNKKSLEIDKQIKLLNLFYVTKGFE